MSTDTMSMPMVKRSMFADSEFESAVLAEKKAILAKVPARDRSKAEDMVDAAIVKRHASGTVGVFAELVALYASDMRAALGGKLAVSED